VTKKSGIPNSLTSSKVGPNHFPPPHCSPHLWYPPSPPTLSPQPLLLYLPSPPHPPSFPAPSPPPPLTSPGTSITPLPNGHAVSRLSDLIIYSVEAAQIAGCVAEYGPSTKLGATVAGQTSVKAPEREAFDRYLPRDVDVVSVHSLHGPSVTTEGQPLVSSGPCRGGGGGAGVNRRAWGREPRGEPGGASAGGGEGEEGPEGPKGRGFGRWGKEWKGPGMLTAIPILIRLSPPGTPMDDPS